MSQFVEITLKPVGHVRTGFETFADCPARSNDNGETSSIEIDAAFADGLLNIELATHLIVLYWFHRADRSVLHRHQTPGEATRGVFASRSPNRPNPIAFSVVRIEGRSGNTLRVSGLDCLDGTPVIDIKPYVPEDDSVPEAHIGWDCGCTIAPRNAGEMVGSCAC